jgi:ubiquinone biosynthesis accessory factor UbiK
MSNGKFLDDVQARLDVLFKAGPVRDLERNVRAVVSSGFAKLDVATREELEIQAKVLARTREKLEALEQRVAELEARLGAR